MKRILLFLFIVFLGHTALQAQNTACTEQLKIVQRSFDDGLLDDIPLLLADCMKDKNGFTKEEKANAYKLLIQTYLFSEEILKADEVMIQFLSEFPSYKLADNDPKEFINLYNTYRTTPIFKLEVLAGLSFCMPLVVQYFGTYPLPATHPVYKSKTGYSFEINYINTLLKNFNYSIGASFTLSNLGYTNEPFDYTLVTASLNNMYLGLPLALRYNYTLKGLNLFAKAGIEPVLLLKSSADLTRADNISNEPIIGTEDLISFHNKTDLRPFLSVGIKINVGSDQLMLSAGYKFSTKIQFNALERNSNNPLEEKYRFTEDDLLLNQSIVSLSYIRPIYKPKKIR